MKIHGNLTLGNDRLLSAYISNDASVIPEHKTAMNTISMLADRKSADPEIPFGAVRK